MALAVSCTPLDDLSAHFDKVFRDEKVGDIQQQLEGVTNGITLGQTLVPLSMREVAQGVMKGKNGKAIGPDLIPNEILKALIKNETSLAALCEFYNGILQSGSIPESWDKAVATLIPKLQPPTEAKRLRPITLSSHVAKTFSRLLLARMEPCLRPQGQKQFACAGRQPAEMAWLTTQVVHLSREWKTSCYMLKLDLARAFDSVKRVKLAERVVEWAGNRFPFETQCIIRMLASSELILSLPWHDVPLQANSGVKQGATESPALFSRLIDEILSDIVLEDDGHILEGMGCDGAAFMDDVITWKADIKAMQRFVDRLVPMLAQFGLKVQPTKSKLLCLRGDKNVVLWIDNQQVKPLGPDETFTVLNLPIHAENTEMKIVEALLDRARGKFYQILHILTSNAALSKRLQVLNTVVWGTISWVIGIIFPTKQCQEALNKFQYACVRKMMGIKRGNEYWVDYEARSLRAARAMVHRMEHKRWGDKHLAAYWAFTGHRVRAGAREGCSAAGRLSHFRGLGWWQQQQRSSGGRRHGHHFPFLMNCERSISRVAGTADWRVLAANRVQWAERVGDWIQQEAVPWSSGRQPSLDN